MKRNLLTMAALFCITLLHAQNGRLPAEVNPGEKGQLPEIAAVAPARTGELAILELSYVGYSSFIINGYVSVEASLSFPMVELVGCDYYTVEYKSPASTTWSVLTNGGEPAHYSDRTVGVSPVISGMTDYRLVLHGGEHDGYVSNTVTAQRPTMYSRYRGWSESPTIEHTMVGHPIGEELSFNADTYNEGNITEYSDYDGYFTYQWYRRNPNNYDMEAIPGATSKNYTPTIEDAGYQLVIEVGGDKVHCDFTLRYPLNGVVCVPVQASVGYIGNDGFVLNTDYVIPEPQKMFVRTATWAEDAPEFNPACITERKPGQYEFRLPSKDYDYAIFDMANPAYFLTFHYDMMGWYREVQMMSDRYKGPLGVKAEFAGAPVQTMIDVLSKNIDDEWVVVASKSMADAVDGVLNFTDDNYMDMLFQVPCYVKARATASTAETFYPNALSMSGAQTVVPGYDEEWNPMVVNIDVQDIAASVGRLSLSNSSSARFYSVDGRSGRSRGLNIVRMDDGTVKKVIVQ